jgi:hypothetical protein
MSEFLGVGLGVEKGKNFGVGVGTGVKKKEISELKSESELKKLDSAVHYCCNTLIDDCE